MASLIAMAGFMGSGKSSVGREVASRMGYDFIDLDERFEAETGTSIADYFKDQGEESFRQRETRLLHSLLDTAEGTDTVLALGGGTLEDSANREQLILRCRVIALSVDADEAWERVVGSDRPLAVDKESFVALHTSRLSTYDRTAHWVLPTAGSTEVQLAERVCDVLRKSGTQWPQLWGRWLRATSRPSLIIGGSGALQFLEAASAEASAAGCSLHVITDHNVLESWGDKARLLLHGLSESDTHILQPGETTKSAQTLIGCWDWLAERKARRQDVIVALGGGVVGDVAGLVASTYHRGVRLWQIPTSLVAQVDSSVGGKTAINLNEGKNLVGTFYQPDLVVIDPATLRTLPENEYRGALGEVIKHGLLRSAESLTWLEDNAQAIVDRDEGTLAEMLHWNVFLKASVVEADERESGLRAVLNLGHTTAHALENVLGYGTVDHGRAVALGLLVSLAMSERLLGLDHAVRSRVRALLDTWGVKSTLKIPSAGTLFEAVAHDKKASKGSSGFVGLRHIGDPVWGLDVGEDVFADSLEVIRA